MISRQGTLRANSKKGVEVDRVGWTTDRIDRATERVEQAVAELDGARGGYDGAVDEALEVAQGKLDAILEALQQLAVNLRA